MRAEPGHDGSGQVAVPGGVGDAAVVQVCVCCQSLAGLPVSRQ